MIQYQYDGVGNLTELTYPDGKTVTYVYDSADRLDHLTDWAGRTTQYSYDAHSRLSTISLPNGTVRTYGYDSVGRLNLIQDKAPGGQVISQFNLEQDLLGRISNENITPAPAPFTVVPASMTVDDDDRLATWNGQTTVSDPDGNITTGPLNGTLTTFGFDARNRLTGVAGTTYTYDAENRRVSQTAGGVTTSYVNDPQGALSRLLVATTVSSTTRYVYANGLLLYADTGSGIQVYHFDSRGSTAAISDGTGTVTDRIVYGDYGETVSRTGTTATPFLFNGAYGVQTDSNGLCYMRARYYSVETRRFLSRDPIGFGGGLNWYAYCNGDPVNGMDPLGLVWGMNWLDNPAYDASLQTISNFSAGMGDVVSVGVTAKIRGAYPEYYGGVDTSSGAYNGGEYTGMGLSLVLGGGRLAYAGIAKAGSVIALTEGATEANALGAMAFRNTLKSVFNLGMANPGMTADTMALKYGTDWAAWIAASGRTATGAENALFGIRGSWNLLGGYFLGAGTRAVLK